MSFNASISNKNMDLIKNHDNTYNNSVNNNQSNTYKSNQIYDNHLNTTSKNSQNKIKIEDENQNSNFFSTNKNSDFDYINYPYNTNPMKNTSLKNFASTSNKLSNYNENYENKTNYFQDVNLNELHSKIMLEPIIIKDYFIQNIQKDMKKNKHATDIMDLKLLEYNILKEIIDSCGSFPVKHRINFLKYLYSLPNDHHYFDLVNKRGMHPFFRNLEINFNLKDIFTLKKLKNLCSNIAFWSEEVGNVFFLPNMVYPFLKCLKGNDLFIFELLIVLINCFCQYWFEYYPGAPLDHLKLCEKIIERENPPLYKFFKKNEKKEKERIDEEIYDKCNLRKKEITKINDPINLKITEICWKFMQSFYSESLDKTSWMQLIDFLSINSHKPEILLYINSALILISDKLIMKCKSIEELYSLLFSKNLLNYPINSKNMLKVFKLANNLYEKYSNFQLYKYIPHIPFENSDYKMKINFPLDFVGTTAAIKEQIFHEENRIEEKKSQIDLLEHNFKQLLAREAKIQKTYECMVHKEKEKAELLKRELDLILYQKDKLNQELKEKKLDKVTRLQNTIDQSLHLYRKMNDYELKYYDEEIRAKKVLEEFDIKSRLQNEELNNLEMEGNRKLIDLLNLRSKDELMQKHKNENYILDKERNFINRIHDEKWRIEDESYKKNISNILNIKEMEFLKMRDHNLYMEKLHKQKQKDFYNKLLIQQVEKERVIRNSDLNNNFNNYARTSIEENFLNSISKVSNKNTEIKYLNDSCINNYEYELNDFIQDLRKNMNNIELEEKALMEYEHELNKREFDIRCLATKKKNHNDNPEYSNNHNSFFNCNNFSDELNRIENEKHNFRNKKEEIELRKKGIIENLNEIHNYKYQSQQTHQFTNSNNSLKNLQMRTSNNNNLNYDIHGNNPPSPNNINFNSFNSMSSSDLRRVEKENQIREENEKLYKKITNNSKLNLDDINNNNSTDKNNYSSNKIDSDNKNMQSEALTSNFPYDNSFGTNNAANFNNQNNYGNNTINKIKNNEFSNNINNSNLNDSKILF